MLHINGYQSMEESMEVKELHDTPLPIHIFFLKFFWRTLIPLWGHCRATDPLFWTSGDVSSEFQSKSGQPLFELSGGVHADSTRS